MKKKYLILFIISIGIMIASYFLMNKLFHLFEIVALIFTTIFVFPFISKIMPSNIKQAQYAASIITVFIVALVIFNTWPLLYKLEYSSFPQDYSFYLPFISNVTAFIENFYTIRISIVLGIPDLTPIGIKNTIFNLLNIITSICLICLTPSLYSIKKEFTRRNYMNEFKQ